MVGFDGARMQQLQEQLEKQLEILQDDNKIPKLWEKQGEIIDAKFEQQHQSIETKLTETQGYISRIPEGRKATTPSYCNYTQIPQMTLSKADGKKTHAHNCH